MTAPAEPLPWRIVLDANVFFSVPVRDFLLYGARFQLAKIIWSEAILEEVARNWVKVTGSTRAEERWLHFSRQFRAFFDDGRIDQTVPLEPDSRISPKD